MPKKSKAQSAAKEQETEKKEHDNEQAGAEETGAVTGHVTPAEEVRPENTGDLPSTTEAYEQVISDLESKVAGAGATRAPVGAGADETEGWEEIVVPLVLALLKKFLKRKVAK